MEFKHIPVMLEPCMELLGLDRHPDGVFVDGTLGGGGHTQEILSRTRGKVLGIDRDWEALRAAGERLAPFGDRFVPLHGNYANIADGSGRFVLSAGQPRARVFVSHRCAAGHAHGSDRAADR